MDDEDELFSDNTPRIDVMVGEYVRSGLCEVCTTRTRQERTFRGTTMEDLEAQAAIWDKTPIRHRRCEGKGSPAIVD